MKSIKSAIIRKLQSLLGIDALLIRIQTDDTLIACLRNQVSDLEKKLETNYVTSRELAEAINENDFVTEKGLDEAIEDALRDQDWDELISETLSERQCSAAIEQAIEDFDFSDSRSFESHVIGIVRDAVEAEAESDERPDAPISCAVAQAIKNLSL